MSRKVCSLTAFIFRFGGLAYEDDRWSIDFSAGMKSEGFLAAKASGELAPNLGRAPVLVVGETTLGQSKAMERFVARRVGLMGGTDVEAAQIDALAEHVRDIKDAQRAKDFSMFSKKDADDKARLRTEWYETDLPAWLVRLEASLPNTAVSGYGIGTERSYFDFSLWAAFRDSVRAGEDEPPTLAALATTPKLMAILDAVDQDPTVQAWVKRRPTTPF
jgi:glutathione S-transferase